MRKGSFGPDNKFLIDAAFTLAHPVDLAYRQPHNICQLSQVSVLAITQIKNPSLNNHDESTIMPFVPIITIYVPFVNSVTNKNRKI